MAHNPAHRRKLGTAESGSSSQKSSKKHTNPSTTSTSTIYNLTNHLSKLNPNTNTNSEYPQKQVKEVSKSVNWESSNANANPNPSLRKLRVGGKMKCYDAESKSYSDAQVELGNYMVTNCAKVVSADMPSFMQIHAVTFARNIKDSLEKFTSNNLALSLKKEFDGVYGPAWHCVVGTSFGSFVTHSVAGFLYFSLDQKLYVLLFKTAVQRAE